MTETMAAFGGMTATAVLPELMRGVPAGKPLRPGMGCRVGHWHASARGNPGSGRYGRGVTQRPLDVLVIGSGVAGLTTAVCLAEAGRSVAIRTERRHRQTTSSVAGAIWGPHLVERSDRVTRWCAETLADFLDLARDPAAGIRLVSGIEACRGEPSDPGLAAPLGNVTAADPAALPAGFAAGWRYTAPVLSMPVYLDYLLARFERAGGRLEEALVTSLAGAIEETTAPVIVNCSGVGAHHLVPDPAVIPYRGQVVIADNPGITEFFIGHSDGEAELIYVFPHGDRVVLGGTEVAGDWSLEPDPQTAKRILRDCATVDPRLASGRVREHRVGLRPVRPLVRLEAEPAARHTGQDADDGRLLVHNYGHGGGGVTLSWGCARQAARLAGAQLPSG